MSNIQLVDIPNELLDLRYVIKKHPKNWIREMRQARGLTTEQLAKMVDVTNPYITMLENSQRGLKVPMVKKLATALGCHPNELTDGPDNATAARNEQEAAMLKLMRMMTDKDQERFIHMGEAFLMPAVDKVKNKN